MTVKDMSMHSDMWSKTGAKIEVWLVRCSLELVQASLQSLGKSWTKLVSMCAKHSAS